MTTMNRRAALKAAGALFGAMATATAVATKPPKDLPDAGWDKIRQWEEEAYGKPGSVRRCRHDEAHAAMLPAYREVAAAMNAVLAAGLEVADDSEWLEDVDGIRYFADWFASVLESEANWDVRRAADAELARRVEAHERGGYHHCPVFWGYSAIERAQEAARMVLDRDDGPEEPHVIEDVRYQAWGMGIWDMYTNEASSYMNAAAEAAWKVDLLERIAS